ncbi:MAG: DNA polymerase III subunit beta [Methylococcales bacterium]
MKFDTERDAFLQPLQEIVGVIEKKQTLPILANVLIDVNNENISFTGTDLEIQLLTTAKVSGKNVGKITVPARKLLDIFRYLPNGKLIKLDFREDKLRLVCGKSRFSLSTLPAENYPKFENDGYDHEIILQALKLRKGLEKTQFCMALQDVRYYLVGILLEIEGRTISLVSSDGHRMAVFTDNIDENLEERMRIILPRKAVLELYRLLTDCGEAVTLKFSKNGIQMTVGNTKFSSKLIEGKYPDFKKIFPQHSNKVSLIDKELLKDAINRVAILSNEQLKDVRLDMNENLLRLRTNNQEQEEAEEEIVVDYKGSPFNTGYNASYLHDAISQVSSDQVRLTFFDQNDSCLVEDLDDSTFRYLLMPVRA